MPVQEVLRSNDPVAISWASALLAEAGIPAHVFDQHASVVEGSVIAIQKRLMVGDDDAAEARRLIADAGIDHGRP